LNIGNKGEVKYMVEIDILHILFLGTTIIFFVMWVFAMRGWNEAIKGWQETIDGWKETIDEWKKYAESRRETN